jgi:hypothetical protein
LRLYVTRNLPGVMVKPTRTPGWQPAPRPSMATEFLDPLTKQIRVPARENFVGRRRQLQNCLRALTQPGQLGVLIHGMGGLGKSSLAARLCDRLPQFQRLVWQGHLDEANLANKLAEAMDDPALRERLQASGEELRFRLRAVFQQLADRGTPPFLLVLDDFEQNLEPRGNHYVMKGGAVSVLQDLIWAMQQGDPRQQLMMTSRYDFELAETQSLYRQPMDALQGADLQKKCRRLSFLKPPESAADATEADRAATKKLLVLQEQVKCLADGNPRLLEKLNDEVLTQQGMDTAAKAAQLESLAADPEALHQEVLNPQLLAQMQVDPVLQAMLTQGLVFKLPVPKEVFEAVTQAASASLVERAIALGLLECSPENTVRVPRLLLLEVPEQQELYARAAKALYQCWWEDKNVK